jgi:hypothetical protein
MSQSLISFIAGIAAVPFVAVCAAARYSRGRNKGERPGRWLDTHPLPSWMCHKHCPLST